MATRIGIYIWMTLPPGMTPEQAAREVRTSIAFGKPEVKLQFIEEGAPEERWIVCTCKEPDHPMCDDPRWHISCGCVPL